MTRINAGIPPAELSDKHLIAEHREIKRIPNHLAKHWSRLFKNGIESLPKEFTLGKGHVLFFIDKGAYTYYRYEEIYEECLKRGFLITYFGYAWEIYDGLDSGWRKNWEPTPEAIKLIKERIKENNAKAAEKAQLKKQQK